MTLSVIGLGIEQFNNWLQDEHLYAPKISGTIKEKDFE
jgi:hypothetical protein